MEIVDTILFTPQLVESSDDGITRIEGVFQRSDAKNANGRVYPRKLWEKLLGEKSPVTERVKSRAMIGHLEHPKDGVTDLRKGALLVTGLSLDENGQVIGKAELLNTPDGQLVQEYVRRKVRIGISSRGSGTVGADGKVSEDYNLETFDIVHNPSTPGAYPEGVEEGTKTTEQAIDENTTGKETVMEGIEKFQLLEANLKPLLAQGVESLVPFQVTDLNHRLLEASVKLGALSSEHQALSGMVEEVQKRISEKRTQLSQAADSKVAESGEDFSAIEDLLDEATRTVEEARNNAEENEKALNEAKETIEKLQQESGGAATDEEAKALYEAQAEALNEAKETIEGLEERLAAAISLLSELIAEEDEEEEDEEEEEEEEEEDMEYVKGKKKKESVDDDEDKLAEDIASAIVNVVEAEPRLKEAMDILADCKGADEVYETAEALLKKIKEDVKRTPGPRRRQLQEELSARRESIFEGLRETILESEDDVSRGVLRGEDETRLDEHKGRKLTLHAIKNING